MAFPRIEPVIISYLSGLLAVRLTAELENNFPVPIAHVISLGGRDDGFRMASATVDIDYYGATRAQAEIGAHEVQDALLNARGAVVDGGSVIAYARTTIGPRWLSSSRTNVRRFGATYQIGVHLA